MTRRTRRAESVWGWGHWSETEARTQLDEWATTGESAAGFARRKGVSTQRLAYWKKRLATRAKAKSAPAFVAVAMPATTTARRKIEIRVADVAVVVEEGCDIEEVIRLVDALARRTRAC